MLFIHCKQKKIFNFIIIHCIKFLSAQLGQYISSANSLIHTLGRFIKIDPNLAGLLTTVKLGTNDPTRIKVPDY